MEKIQILRQLTLLHQQNATRRRHQQPTSLLKCQRLKEITQKYGQLRKQIFRSVRSKGNLKEAILCQNPVPNNLDNVKKLDDFLRDILKKKHKINEQNIENNLEKLHRKTVDVMSRLSKLCNILEGAKEAEEDAVQISINDLLHYAEQTVLLLG